MRSTSDGGKTKLMKVSIDGGDAVPIMAESAKSEFYPRISGDGKFLAFHTFEYDAANPNIEPKVKIVGFDGEKTDANTKEFDSIINPEFKFSPDNKSLTYLNRGGIDNLFDDRDKSAFDPLWQASWDAPAAAGSPPKANAPKMPSGASNIGFQGGVLKK